MATQEEVDQLFHENSDIPKLGRHEVGTTASEFDGAFDAAGDEDEGAENIGVDDKSDDLVSADERKSQRNAKKVCDQLCPSQT